MLPPDPSQAISAATASLVLVYGVGILRLTLNTSYIQATSRTRGIYGKSIEPDCLLTTTGNWACSTSRAGCSNTDSRH